MADERAEKGRLSDAGLISAWNSALKQRFVIKWQTTNLAFPFLAMKLHKNIFWGEFAPGLADYSC